MSKSDKNISSAVALKYPSGAYAPFIAAKQKGILAQKMIDIAVENNIPVVENELVNNILMMQEIGDFIPEETWEAVAGIFAFIQKLERENVNDDKIKL